MVVECSHCGGPLNVREGATFRRCAYCGRTDERKNLRTIHERTPEEFVQPARWKPPAHVPAASRDEEYEYTSPSQWTTGSIVLAGAMVLFGAGLSLVLTLGHPNQAPSAPLPPPSTPAARKYDPSLFATLGIDGTMDDLRRRFAVEGPTYFSRVVLDLASGDWKTVAFAWELGFANHPSKAFFYRRTGTFSADDAARISRAIGVPLRVGGYWDWANLRIQLDSGTLWCSVLPQPKGQPADPDWKRKIVVAYSVLKEVAFGQKSSVSIDERRALLGVPYPLADLARIEATAPVDDAAQSVRKSFPGVLVTQKSNLDLFFSVDHPRVPTLTMRWPNARDATLSTVFVEPPRSPAGSDSGGLAPYLDELARCFAKTFGTPTTTDVDYLKKKKKHEFTITGARLSLGEKELRLSADGNKGIPQAAWTTFVTTLDGCR